MDQVFISALVRQALSAYALHGEAGLEQWKAALPAPHLEQFEEHCSGPLSEAIAALSPVLEGAAQKGCKHRNVVPRGHNELVKGGYVCLDCGAILKDKPLASPGDKPQSPTGPRKTHRVDPRRTKPL